MSDSRGQRGGSECRTCAPHASLAGVTRPDTVTRVLPAVAAIGSMPSEPVDRGEERSGEPSSQAFLREYRGWVAVALFLLVTVDMLTAMIAAAALGPEAEANPLVRWTLRRGTPTLVAVNVFAVVLAVGFFYALRGMLRRTRAGTAGRSRCSSRRGSDCWCSRDGACWRTTSPWFSSGRRSSERPGQKTAEGRRSTPGSRSGARATSGELSTLCDLPCDGVPDGSDDHLG